MSKDFDIFVHTVRLARPMATSLSQKMTVAGWGDLGWPGWPDRDAGRVGGDGVVDGVVREEGRRVVAHVVVAHVVGRASDGPSSGTGEIRRIRMDAQNHLGGPIDFAPIRMGRDKAEETVKAGHGGKGGGDLF